jgi:hypothetical protein
MAKKKTEMTQNQIRKSKGLCAHCGNKALPQMVNCQECREKYSLIAKNRARNFRSLGLCVKCGGETVRNLSVCEKCRLVVRIMGLRAKGLSEDEIEKAKQATAIFNGICPACGNTNRLCQTSKEWAFDHDHASLVFRGIIGCGCNSALGFAGDSSASLIKLSEYLKRHGR